MRLLYLADIRLPLERANGIQTMQTCHALARLGHEITLIVRPDPVRPARDVWAFYDVPPHDRLHLVRIAAVGPPIARRLTYLMAAAGWAMGRASADLLFTRDLGVASLLTRLPEGSRPPLVYESHGFSPAVSRDMGELLSNASGASPLKQRRLYRRERRVWHRADGYVTITAALAARLAATFGARPGVAVVPDGAAPAVPRDVRSPALTAGLTLGYAGHLYPWKGVDVLIDAMADLPRARALIIGGHPREDDLARLERRVRERGLRDRVELTGPIAPTDVARALARADVLVLPNRATTLSAEATSPLKLFEYMALGKPIVASDLPAIREIVGDGEAAELVAPDDPSALARGVARLVADPDRAAALAATALARSSDYSWDRRAERLAACFAEVVATR